MREAPQRLWRQNGYVDEIASGIKAKPSARVATIANLNATYNNGTNGVGATLTANSNGALTVDSLSGFSVNQGILVKNQTTAAQNGRYVVTTVGDGSTPWVLTRCGLCNEASEIPGAYIFVTNGTSAGKGFVLTVSNPDTFVVGTDAINVVQFSSAGSFLAGTGLVLDGSYFNVQTANSARIVVNADNIDLASVNVNNVNGANTLNFISSITVDQYGRVTDKESSQVDLSGVNTAIGLRLLSTEAANTYLTTATASSTYLTTATASSTYLTTATAANTYIANSIVDAKGDLIVASAADTVGRLAAGTNGQFLKANSSTASGLQWADIPTINNLDDVGDVTITGNATNQYLKYNGSAWVNASIPTINALDDVGDVTITSAVANQVLLYNGSAWINTSNPTVAGNLTVSGDLTVNGTTTTINTATLNVSDNIIVLNNDVTGSPSENAGIEVERGTSTNVLVRWNETDDCWEFTNDGTKYERIVGDTLTNAQTAAYTLVLADRSKMVEMSVASGHNLTVPTNANVAFPVGTTITVLQTGAGQTTIAGQSGVTINATPGLKLRAQWSSATLIKRATDTWVALGDLAA